MKQEDFNKAMESKTEKPWNILDCERICNVALQQLGITITPEQAEIIWSDFSESMAAGWMCMPERDAQIVGVIESYVSKRV